MATKNIHDARLTSVKELGTNSKEFVISPLYYGYGNTLGNSLRRVLLSSIKGAAITAFEIEGTNHEYTAIPGVREDVVDIMLNLKNIHFKLDSDEAVELTLEVKGSEQVEKDGEKRVTADNIKLPEGIEVNNPNQVICHIDDPNFVLKMRFIVENGRGYMTIEESSNQRKYANMIAVDAVFSPVLRVRYKVENTRVGQDTNLQQLALTIDTDGTIRPEDAFEEAAAILVNQYQALAGSTVIESAPTPGEEARATDKELQIPIESLGLSARTTNALINNEIRTVAELIQLDDVQLRDLKGFGAKAHDEVRQAAAKWVENKKEQK